MSSVSMEGTDRYQNNTKPPKNKKTKGSNAFISILMKNTTLPHIQNTNGVTKKPKMKPQPTPINLEDINMLKPLQ